jgi:GNAT superfamily N-acetyltransferase
MVTICAIQPSDTTLEADFIRDLSALTKHYRLFGAVKASPAADVSRRCRVDGFQSMAILATVQDGGREVDIGVCRYAPTAKAYAREIAVTIADDWQHSELAQILVQHLIEWARRNGVRELYVELSDNQTMSHFARTIDMSAARNPEDATQAIYSLSP